MLFRLKKELKMCNLHMTIHETYTLNFDVFNLILVKNIFLCQSIGICWFIFTNDALQHLLVHQIHKWAIVDNKKSLTYKHRTMMSLSYNLLFIFANCKTSTYDILPNFRCIFFISKTNEKHIWMGAIDTFHQPHPHFQ